MKKGDRSQEFDEAFGLGLAGGCQRLRPSLPTCARVADARWAARNAKDWAEADRLRGELTALGWTMKDGKDGYTLTRG